MITEITKYVTEDGVEYLKIADAENHERILRLANELQHCYEIDEDWQQLARFVASKLDEAKAEGKYE